MCLGLWLPLLTLVAMHILPPVSQEQKRGIFCCEMFSGLREEHRAEQKHVRAVSDQLASQSLSFLVLMLHLKPVKNGMDKIPAYCCCFGL